MLTKLNLLHIYSGLFLIILFSSCKSMDYGTYNDSPFQIVEIEHYGIKGVIFPDSTSFPLGFRKPGNFNERYSPSVRDIEKFEDIFHESYNDFRKAQPYHNPEFEFTGETYAFYTRQYFGYVDEKNHRHMMVIFQAMDKNRARKNWYKSPSYAIPGDWIIFCDLETDKLLSVDDIGFKES